MDNPFAFAPLSKEEKRKASQLEKTQKEIDIAAKGALQTAQDCLSSDLFAKYRTEYLEAEKGLIEIGIRLNMADPVAYAVNAHNIFTNLKILRMLGDSVTKDVERKINE